MERQRTRKITSWTCKERKNIYFTKEMIYLIGYICVYKYNYYKREREDIDLLLKTKEETSENKLQIIFVNIQLRRLISI